MKTQRFYFIDVLRAMSILGVIAIHVYSQHLTNYVNTSVWNYLQFFVPPFIFCSGYVLFAQYQDKLKSLDSTLIFYKRRLYRLLVPFYVYLIIHYILVVLFPKLFNGFGLQFNLPYILKSIFLIGGVNINWLPLLFFQLALIFPLLIFLYSRKVMLAFYILASLVISAWFTITIFPYTYYRFVMWIPWSLIFLLAFYISSLVKFSTLGKQVLHYAVIAALSSSLFIGLYFLLTHLGKSVNLYDNKYPPNLFYLSYGIWTGTILFGISNLKIWNSPAVKKTVLFISTSSYSLFFIHWILLDLFTTSIGKFIKFSVGTETVTIILIALLLQKVLIKVKGLFSTIWYSIR